MSFADSMSNSPVVEDTDVSGDWECWDLAVTTYQIFDDVGHSREKCIEMGVWAYNSCMEELENDLDEMIDGF